MNLNSFSKSFKLEPTIWANEFLCKHQHAVFSKTVKAAENPIFVHYLAQQVLQTDKFWENYVSNSARSMHFLPIFVLHQSRIRSLSKFEIQTYVHLQSLIVLIQVVKLIEGVAPLIREKSAIKSRHFCQRKTRIETSKRYRSLRRSQVTAQPYRWRSRR